MEANVIDVSPTSWEDYRELVEVIAQHHSLRGWSALADGYDEGADLPARLRLRLTSTEVNRLVEALMVVGPLMDRLMPVTEEVAGEVVSAAFSRAVTPV